MLTALLFWSIWKPSILVHRFPFQFGVWLRLTHSTLWLNLPHVSSNISQHDASWSFTSQYKLWWWAGLWFIHPKHGRKKRCASSPFSRFFKTFLMWKNHVKLNISHSMFLCNSEYVWRGNLSLRLCGALGLKEPLSPISSVTLGILFDSWQ